ncbi:erythromycin esterase family protein [Noviherbaspirillum massiliense]|uniref:erythromycin esterase family protein n=1 Tax=Noviherbaspirillum massiliense TaxID=1465823 RepID=UPI0002FB89D6|nr:erythromycin esterase family protein [Noviherbaspirillum massiliense]
MSRQPIVEDLRREAHAWGHNEGFNPLIEQIGDASVVLLGEATHGSHEFYRARAEISKRLIYSKGFDAIAVEADWPDALCISRYVQSSDQNDGTSNPASDSTIARDKIADEALQGFTRFPRWMWRNTEIVELIGWLRSHNMRIAAPDRRIGFFGLDLYSLRKSMDAVVRYLDQVDPAAARNARYRYSCFDHLAEDPQRYGYAATFGTKKNCEEEVVQQLVALTSEAGKYLAHDGRAASDELFYAQQNARVAQNAEAYYRSMFHGRDESWNLRDTHMMETLYALREHIGQRKGSPAKIIVWAHNSHIGDARATEMGDHGQLNLGQLVRERFGAEETFLLGFSTHAGTVTAASDWDSPAILKTIIPSRQDSFERLFHNTGLGNFMLPIRGNEVVSALLDERRLERAIGVIYLPETERLSHYFHASMARQFDAVIHLDHTSALRPLDPSPYWKHEEVPETYPSGI